MVIRFTCWQCNFDSFHPTQCKGNVDKGLGEGVVEVIPSNQKDDEEIKCSNI
jgi:hypothetical protein